MAPPKPPVPCHPHQLSKYEGLARNWLLKMAARDPHTEYGWLQNTKSRYRYRIRGKAKGRVRLEKGPVAQRIANRSLFVDFHHNHPSNRSLSSGDISLILLHPGFHSIWAHGNKGPIYRARVSRLQTGGNDSAVVLLLRMFDLAYAAARKELPRPDPNGEDVDFFVPHIVAHVLHERGIIEFSGSITSSEEERWRRNADVLQEVTNLVRQIR